MPTARQIAELYAYPDTGRAYVRTNTVQSVDGAVQDPTGLSGGLGGAPDERALRIMRSLADVIVVGAGTARAEGYAPVRADEIDVTARAAAGLPGLPPIAVVSRSLDLPDALVAPGQILITFADSDADRRAELARTMDVIVAGTSSVDWTAVLDLFTTRGLLRVLCEGGPSLTGELLSRDLVDEMCVTIAPTALAGNAKRVAVSPAAAPRPLALTHAVEDDGVLLTRWQRDRGTERDAS